MKKLFTTIIVLVFLAFFSFISCSEGKEQEPDPVKLIDLDTVTFTHSMKGWELYSWPNGNDWNYSVLPGTNRLKSYNEVIENKIVVLGIDSLKMLLDKLPAKEEISWIGEGWLKRIWGTEYRDLSLPDSIIIKDIKNYCSQKELILSIVN